ncbi:MAG: alpha-E domain-containing protein, partial [Methylobacter sp.]
PLGSSVLENPGLLPFLPKLSRYFLNEELMLPSVATWWCGQRRERDFVLQNLDRLVIKPINRSSKNYTLFGALLSSKEKELLRAAIIAKPHCYVGQEHISFSTVPSFIDHHIEPRFAVLRSFAVASGDGYQVMPGGLTRIAPQQDDFIISNQAGGISKDTWVLTDEPDKQVSLWFQPGQDVILSADTEPLTSRAANNLFWVGRYLERIKAPTRLMRMILLKLAEVRELGDQLDSQCINILLNALTQVTGTYPGFVSGNASVLKEPQNELMALAKNVHRSGTLAANIQAFAQTAFSIRDVWSQDTWRCVDNIQRRWQQRVVHGQCDLDQLQKSLDDLITGFVAFIGLTTESMTREAGWLMLDSGRRLEHALTLISLLRATVVQRHESALQNQLLEAVLISTDSLSIYRRRYRSFITLPMVLELLLMDETHPRSLAYQLHQLSGHINELPKERGKGRLSEEERLILRAYTDLRLVKIPELVKVDDDVGGYTDLENVLSAMTEQLWRLYEVLAQAYFSHSQLPQLMTPTQAEDDL